MELNLTPALRLLVVIVVVISCFLLSTFFSIEVRAQTSVTEEPTELVSEPPSNTTSTQLNESLSTLAEDAVAAANPTTIKIISTCEFRNGTCGLLLDNLFEVSVFKFFDGERKMVNQFAPSDHGRTISLFGSESPNLPESLILGEESLNFGPESLILGEESLIPGEASESSNLPIQYVIRQVQRPIEPIQIGGEQVFNDFTTYSSECVGEINPGENKECRIHTNLSIRP